MTILQEFWYCPFCGQKMERKSEGWFCARGELYLSWQVENDIFHAMQECHVQSCGNVNSAFCDDYYCPQCGKRLYLGNQNIRICAECHKEFQNRIFYQLREYHAHQDIE